MSQYQASKMTQQKLHFIVIDDSKLDCFIAEKIIRNTGVSESIKSFVDAREALEHIKNHPATDAANKTILIVDIQMPVMNGFEFVEAFEELPEEIQKGYIIYVLSSSINESDLTRVRNYKSVKHFLNKPLTSNTLSTLVEWI
ncbi:MAG: response regulator [Bacteroidetes bacterium]|nr:response regulator [Bacteroidota bacterium]